jgi:small subunit ribosomal protein S6
LNEYELLYIVSPRVPADDVPNAIGRVSALITAQGGEVISTDDWGRRRLAYPIRQYFEGTYVLTTLRMPPAGAPQLESQLRISEEVIRHLLTSGIIPPRQPRPRFDDRDRDRGERDGGGERSEAPRAEVAEEAPAAEPVAAPATEPVAESAVATEAEAPVAAEAAPAAE